MGEVGPPIAVFASGGFPRGFAGTNARDDVALREVPAAIVADVAVEPPRQDPGTNRLDPHPHCGLRLAFAAFFIERIIDRRGISGRRGEHAVAREGQRWAVDHRLDPLLGEGREQRGRAVCDRDLGVVEGAAGEGIDVAREEGDEKVRGTADGTHETTLCLGHEDLDFASAGQLFGCIGQMGQVGPQFAVFASAGFRGFLLDRMARTISRLER